MEVKDLVEKYADETGEDFGDVLKRWDGKPENIAEDLFRVRDADTRKPRKLSLFPYQKTAIRAYFYGDSSTISVYKGRRIGATFIFLLAALIDGTGNENLFFPIVCPSEEAAKKRIDDIKTLIEDAVIDIEAPTTNSKKIVLWNDTRFEAFTGGADSGRGDDPARAVFIDEMAFLEDQKRTLRAFRPFISLGSNNKIIQVSTPTTDGDKFMKTHKSGSPTGYADEKGNKVRADHPDAERVPISIKQPSFHNADGIDISTSLHRQDAKPVRPDMDVDAVEEERMSDPKGFAQEYLCRPISDEYRFFRLEDIKSAQERGSDPNYVHGPFAEAQHGGMMVMSLDLAFGGDDDTVMCVWEHKGDARRGNRYLRYWEVVDENTISKSGVAPASKSNPNHVAKRAADVYERLGCDHLIYDATGGGAGFKDILVNHIGRGVHPFNFTDKEAMNQMMLDFNYGLHNNQITLVPDEDMEDQLKSIVKMQDEDWKHPRYSGKEQSPSGKDDIAISLVLGAYPSMLADGKSNTLQEADDHEPTGPAEGESTKKLRTASSQSGPRAAQPARAVSYGAVQVARSDPRRYESRHGHSQRKYN